MKYFTEPKGRFIIEIPTEWQYKNKIAEIGEVSPFSFEPYKNSHGAFQISCYPVEEKAPNSKLKVQKVDTDNLEFVENRMDGGGFNMHIWYCVVEDVIFMAKYIYDTKKEKNKIIKRELEKAKKALSTLKLLSPEMQEEALVLDRYEKFMSALAASFDIKNKALKNKSPIEFIIIVASQIDAYLRLCIVMTIQLNEKSDNIEIKYLSQQDDDVPIMEKKIYKLSNELDIIDEETLNDLNSLYNLRNKVVHRYIISEITTMEIHDIAYGYDQICETIRKKLAMIEERQAMEKIGIYKRGLPDNENLPNEFLNTIFSQVNDKHSLKRMYR